MGTAGANSSATRSDRNVYLRIPNTNRGWFDRVSSWLLEIDPEGDIHREVALAADGSALRITRPGQRGDWNDSYPIPPPGTPEFVDSLGRWGSEISEEAFAEEYARADRALPNQGRRTDRYLFGALIVILSLMVAGVVALALSEFVRALSG